MSIKADEVLDLLDRHINNDPLTFGAPLMYQLWSHFFPADTRLSVFRSEDRWTVFVEIVCFRPGCGDSSLDIWGYGNCLSEPVLGWDDTPYEFCPAQSTDEDGEEMSYPETPFAFCIIRDGESQKFSVSPEEYAAMGVVVDPDIKGHADHIGGYILRFLCDRLNHPFFMSEGDLRQLLEENWREGEAPCVEEMAQIWQTQQWRHPAITGRNNDMERPRRLPYFQALARAIETGDVSELERQDPATFNTNWRIWDAQERAEEAEWKASWAIQAQTFQQLPPEMQEQSGALRNVSFGVGHIHVEWAEEESE